MYPCHCCKSAHHDISLLSHWSPSESDEEIVNETILSELGETSLHWFDTLTDTYLAGHCGHDHGSLSASPNFSEGWSPFPKGGIHYIPDSTGKQMTTGDMTPLTALLYSPRQSENDLQLRAGIQAITDPINAISQVDLNWTIGMATPVEKHLADKDKEENFHELGQVRTRKVTHRQLFSPSGSSACDDSFSLVEGDWTEGNLTVETEKTITSETDLSCGNEVTLCEEGHDVSWASAKVCDNSCEEFESCDQRVGGVSCLDRASGEQKDKSPRSAVGCDLNFSNDNDNRCSPLFEDSFGSAWERASDFDLSVVRSKSDEKSVQAKVATKRVVAVLKKTRKHSSSVSHIEKVLAKVFDGDGDEEPDSSKDIATEDACRDDTLPDTHDASVEPDCVSKVYRKRLSVETTPHAKKQKLEHGSKTRAENDCNSECKMAISDQTSSLDCSPNFSVDHNQGTPEPLKYKDQVISILKNPMTPKNTCKKRVQFNLDIHHAVNISAVKAGFQLTSADTLCHLVSTPKHGRDAASSTDLSEYFFKNAGSCRSAETLCQGSENRSKCNDSCHPSNQTVQPLTVEVDLTGYNFDSSFEASPTFSSQVCPSKAMQQVSGHQDHVGSDIVPDQVMAAELIVKRETDVDDGPGGGSCLISQGNSGLEISLKDVVSDRVAGFCDVDACVAAAEAENLPEMSETMLSNGSGMDCLQSEFCDIEINCDNFNNLGGTHASIGQFSSEKCTLKTLVDNQDKLDISFTLTEKSSPTEATPTEQALEELPVGVPSAALIPSTTRASPNVEVKPALSLGSTRPRKFRYPTADQIARSNPDRPISEDYVIRPSVNRTGQVSSASVIQPTTAGYQRANQGESEKSQFSSREAVSENELQTSEGNILGFVTFSEAYNNDIPESNLLVKNTFPSSMFCDSLSTKLSVASAVSHSSNSVISSPPLSTSTCNLRTSHILTASSTPKNGNTTDINRTLQHEGKLCTASSVESPCLTYNCQPNTLSNCSLTSVDDKQLARGGLSSVTASTSQDLCLTHIGNSSKPCPTADSGSPPAVNDDDTLPSQIWAATEFSQIEEGFDLEVSVCAEGQDPVGSTPKQISEKSADLSVTFSGKSNQLQNYASNNEAALTIISTSVPTSSCSTYNIDLGNCSSNVNHVEATSNLKLGKCSSNVKQLESTSNINSGKCSSTLKQDEAASNIKSGKCSSNVKQVEATSNINLGKCSSNVKQLESTSNINSGKCSSTLKQDEAASNIKSGKCSSNVKQVEATSNIDSGKSSSNVKQVEVTYNVNSGKCSDIKNVEVIANLNTEKTDHEVLDTDDFTFCYAGQSDPSKLIPACPEGFATASGHRLSHFVGAQANKCMDNLEDQLEFLLSSRKEKVDSKEEARPNSSKTKQQGIQNVKTSSDGVFPGRDTTKATTPLEINTKNSIKMGCNVKSSTPVDKDSESLKLHKKNQYSESCTVSNSMVRSFTSDEKWDIQPALNPKAKIHPKTNILPSNEELQADPNRTASFDFPQHGFSTAGGKQISLSESARSKAKKIWDSVNQDSDLNGSLITDESLAGDPSTISADMKVSEFSSKGDLEGVAVDDRPKGFRPFKPPSLKRKNDSRPKSASPKLGEGPGQQKRPSLELDEWGDDSVLRDIIKDEEHLSLAQKTEDDEVMPKLISELQSSKTSLTTKVKPPLTSGFTTGSGKHVSLSKKALQVAEKFWKEFEADAAALDTCSSADLLTSDTEHAKKIHSSTIDLNCKQPFATGSKLTKSGVLSREKLKGPNPSSISVSQGNRESLIKENSGNVPAPSDKLLTTGKRLWSPNEELSLNSEFSFENVSTNSDCAGYANVTAATSNGAEPASMIGYCAARAFAALKAANDLHLLGQRDLTVTDTNRACDASGVSVSVSKNAHIHAKLDGYTTTGSDQMNRQGHISVKAFNEEFSLPTAGVSLESLPSPVTPIVQSCVHQKAKSAPAPSDKPAHKVNGFSTASGSKVTVSEKALRQAKALFDESNDTMASTTPSSPSSDEPMPVNEALHKMKSRLPGNMNGGSSNKTSNHSGFTTASGCSVSVSEKAWLHARSFLEECHESGTQADNNLLHSSTETLKVIHGFTSSVDKKLLPEKTLKCGSNDCSTDPQGDSETSFNQIGLVNTPTVNSLTGGFSTASGHIVNVSKVAFDHAKGVLKDTLSNSNTETPAIDTEFNNAKSYSGGFSTCSGHKVNGSKVAFDHAKGVLKDTLSNSNTETPAIDTEFNNAKSYSGGFSTCSGHIVNVSKVAFDHAKGVLKDTLSNSNTETPSIDTEFNNAKTYSGGFSTASGHKVNVSMVALDHAKGVLKDTLSNTETPAIDIDKEFNNEKTYSTGFSTALGQKVNVSKAVLKDASLETESSTAAVQLNGGSPGLHVNEINETGLRSDHEAWPKTERAWNTSTPLTDRRSKSCTFAEGGETDPLKRSFTPVSSRCEEFLYDRPVTRSGKRLYPVRPRSLTNELCSATPVTNNLNSKSSFKPPYKKAKLSDEKDLEVPPAAASGPKMSHTTKGSFVPPTFKPPSATPGTKMRLPASKVSSDEMPGDSEAKEPKTPVASKTGSSIAKADVRGSVDLEDDAENLLLCQDFDARSPTSTASCKGQGGQSHPEGHRTCSVEGTRDAQKVHGIPGANSSKDALHPLSELVLEEEKMKQGKIIRAKKRARVRPLCGRWMEARKQKGSLQRLNDLEPATGLTREQLISLGVSASTLEITGLNAREFRFDLRRYYPALDAAVLLGDGALLVPDRCGYAGVEEFYRAFQTLDSVDPGLVDELWLGNHYRWIVWKLAAYEVSLPHHFAGRSLTPDTVMLQLKYRYDREVDACHRKRLRTLKINQMKKYKPNTERRFPNGLIRNVCFTLHNSRKSALKKVIERDETPSKRMVLCVASVVHTSDGQCSVEVTDGWYSIKAQLDDRLADLVSQKKISPGDKLVTSGAELVGGQEACSPLEVKEGMALKLHGNSTRPAPWHSRLGFCLPPSPLCVPIKSLCSGGGHLGCVDVVISKIYPVMYMEKLKEGGCVFRTAEEEDKARQKHEGKREAEMEKIYSGFRNESKENFKGKRRNLKKFSKKDVEKLWDGHEIAEALDIALNPEEVQLLLSESQLNRLMEHRQRETDRYQEEIKKRLADAMAETEVRNVAPVLKVKVSGLSAIDVDDSVSCLVTVWRPGPEWTSIEEGQRYKLYNMPVSNIRGRSGHGKVSLTATRQTRLKPCSVNDNLLDMVFEPREAWTVSDLTSRTPLGNEFDFLGVVIQIKTSTSLSQPSLLYASDKNGEFLCIKIWSGTQMNSLKCGQIFVAYNLSLSSVAHERSSLVVAEARSDLTTTTTNGHSSRYAEAFSEMQVLCKHPDFVNSLKSELEVCLASHGHKPAMKSTSLSRYDAEDFPVEIVDKIFSPMSQCPGSSLKSSGTPTNSSKMNTRQEDECKITLQDYRGSGSKSPEAIETGSVKGHSKPSAEAASLEHMDKIHCGIAEKRKQALRDKMAKLLSYDQPAPLHPLPVAGSPACIKEFKSPVNKKT